MKATESSVTGHGNKNQSKLCTFKTASQLTTQNVRRHGYQFSTMSPLLYATNWQRSICCTTSTSMYADVFDYGLHLDVQCYQTRDLSI